MRALGVVVALSCLDDDLGFGGAVEVLPVKQFVVELRVEALAVAALPGVAGLDERGLCADGYDPFSHRIDDTTRQFLLSLHDGTPDFIAIGLPQAQTLPDVRWKLFNLKKAQGRKPRQARSAAGGTGKFLRRLARETTTRNRVCVLVSSSSVVARNRNVSGVTVSALAPGC